MLWVALVLALLSTTMLQASFVAQHRWAPAAARLGARRVWRTAAAYARAPGWLFALVVGLVGWGLYLAAIAIAPLGLVQAVVAAGPCVLVAMHAAVTARLPSRRLVAGALLAAGGLALLAVSIGAGDAHSVAARAGAMWITTALAATAALAVVGVAWRRRSGALMGVASGLLYGLADIASKALFASLPRHATATALAASPWLWLALATTACAFVLLQLAFRMGSVVATAGPMTVATNVLPIAAAYPLFHEHLPPGALALGVRAGAFAVLVAAGYLLASERDGAGGVGRDHDHDHDHDHDRARARFAS